MRRSNPVLAALLIFGSLQQATSQDKKPEPGTKLASGVYAVLRDGAAEKDVLPLKDGEALAVNRYRFLKPEDTQPPRYLVVHTKPDVELLISGEPKAEKDGDEVSRILLKLEPKAATALEKLTADHIDRPIAVVIGGEVVTTHKVRTAIKSGEVQITCCAPGAAKFLLEQLESQLKKK
jgi:preprotein translocase subunit SecD